MKHQTFLRVPVQAFPRRSPSLWLPALAAATLALLPQGSPHALAQQPPANAPAQLIEIKGAGKVTAQGDQIQILNAAAPLSTDPFLTQASPKTPNPEPSSNTSSTAAGITNPGLGKATRVEDGPAITATCETFSIPTETVGALNRKGLSDPEFYEELVKTGKLKQVWILKMMGANDANMQSGEAFRQEKLRLTIEQANDTSLTEIYYDSPMEGVLLRTVVPTTAGRLYLIGTVPLYLPPSPSLSEPSRVEPETLCVFVTLRFR